MIPLVSVIIPTYNRRKKLARAIDSALSQSYKNIQVIVIDDGSTDGTRELVLDRYHDEILYIGLSRNFGGNYARNQGVKHAEGEYLAFLDSDDEWLPSKLECQLRYIKSKGVKGVCTSHISFFEDSDKSIDGKCFISEGYVSFSDFLLNKKILAAGSSFLVSKETLVEIGAFDERLNRYQDRELISRYIDQYKIYICKEVLVRVYRYPKISFSDISKSSALFIQSLSKLDSYRSLDNSIQKQFLSRQSLDVSYNLIRGCGKLGLGLNFFFRAVAFYPLSALNLRAYVNIFSSLLYRWFGLDLMSILFKFRARK